LSGPEGRVRGHLSLRGRGLILLVAFLILSSAFAYASTVTLGRSAAQSRASQLNGITPSTTGIFLNNVLIALLEFVPILGPAFAVYASYSTGLTLAAEAQTNASYQQLHVTGLDLFFFLLITPIYWLEFFCYSLAVEESVALVVSFRNRDLLTLEWKWLLASVVAVVAVLLVSARLEVLFITFFGGGGGGA
jgi:hypothetical protein